MKKRSLFTMIASLALVGAMGVGATLAYLSDSSGTLVNTFEFGSISLELYENDYNNQNEGEDINATDFGGNSYTNLYPGQKVDKEPYIKVDTSLDCYVYARIECDESLYTMGNVSDEWVLVDFSNVENYCVEENTKYFVYKDVVTADMDDTLESFFDSVTISAEADEYTELSDIVIDAVAVQKEGNEDYAQMAWDLFFHPELLPR